MQDFIEALRQIVAHPDASLVLAVVIKTSGSVPQHVGATMLVDDKGLRSGTVGGGLMESQCLARCQTLIGKDATDAFELTMNDSYRLDAGPICGGKIKIFLTSRLQDQMRFFDAVLRGHKRRDIINLTIDTSVKTQTSGQFAFSKADNRDINACKLTILPPKRVLVSGAGHCGWAIAELADWLGYQVSLIDTRVKEKVSSPIDYHQQSFEAFLQASAIDTQTAIVLVNKGHKEDALALRACIHSPAGYIGMIGSKRKVKLLKQSFLENEWCDERSWSNIYAPIGLALGASEVKEIALSVLAQITKVFNTKIESVPVSQSSILERSV